MEDLSQIIQTIIIILVAGFFVFLLIQLFLPGRKIRITIVNKRITEHQSYNKYRLRSTTVKHHTVDCRYENSDKLHTLRCSSYVYDKLKKSKSYTVTVKMSEIVKIHR